MDTYLEEIEKYNNMSNKNWKLILRNEMLSEQCINYFRYEIDWETVCDYQDLSEKFIRENINKINFTYVARRQKISEDFIREFQSRIDFSNICFNEKLNLSDKFCEEFDEKLGYHGRWIINARYHRTLGPAYKDQFWYRGKYLEYVNSMKDYKRYLNLIAFD